MNSNAVLVILLVLASIAVSVFAVWSSTKYWNAIGRADEEIEFEDPTIRRRITLILTLLNGFVILILGSGWLAALFGTDQLIFGVLSCGLFGLIIRRENNAISEKLSRNPNWRYCWD